MSKLYLLLLMMVSSLLHAQLYIQTDTEDGQVYCAGEEILFTAYNSFDERSLMFFWDFGDGESGEGSPVRHTFTVPGIYMVGAVGVADDAEQSPVFYRLLFITPPEANASLQAQIMEPEIENLVIRAGDEVLLKAGPVQEGVVFIWHLLGTEFVHQGEEWLFQAMPDWGEYEGVIELTAVHSDGSAMTYPFILHVYIFESNHPPDARLVSPEPRVIDDTNVFTVNQGESITLTGTATDPDGPEPLIVGWYDMDEDEFYPGNEMAYHGVETGYFNWSLTAVDADDQWDPFPSYFMIFVRGENQAPEGWIESSSQTIAVNETVTIEAGSYDEEHDDVTYSWTLGDGRSLAGQSIDLSYEEPGSYRVKLIATDALGAQSSPYEIWIFVNNYLDHVANQQPFPTVTHPPWGQMYPLNQIIQFEGFGFDPDGDDLSYYWDFDNGSLGSGSASVSKAYSEAGTYWVTLFVQDSHGFVSHYGEDVAIAVYEGEVPPNGRILAPVVELNRNGDRVLQIKPGTPIQLLAGVDGVTDLTGYTFNWDMDSSGTISGVSADDVVINEPGHYGVHLEVTNPNGIDDPISDWFTIWVRDHNTPPEVWFTEPGWEVAIHETEYLDFSAEVWDEEEDEITVSWTFSDGRSFSGERVEGVNFSQPGLYWVQLSAVDSEGGENTEYLRRYITVFPDIDWDIQEPPYLIRGEPVDEFIIGPTNSQIHFSVSAVDIYDEEIIGWLWDFGNGVTSTSEDPGFVSFTKPGTYEVKVFAQDASNLWTPYPLTWLIGIYGDNVPPDGTITQPAVNDSEDAYDARVKRVLKGSTIEFSGQAMDPDGNLPLSTVWMLNWNPISFDLNLGPITFNDAGYFSVILLVNDSEGVEDPIPDFRIIHVIDPAKTPTGIIGYPDSDLTVEPGEELWFYGYGEDPNELDLSYHWDFGPQGDPSTAVGSDVYPVVFQEETPAGQPIIVTMIAKTEFTQAEPVSVRITVKQYQDQDFEPNDSLDQAFELDFGTYSQMSLSASDQIDNFKFEVTAESRNLNLNLQAITGDAGFKLKLYRREDSSWNAYPLGEYLTGTGTMVLQDMPRGTYALEVTHDSVGKAYRDGITYGISVTTEKPVLYIPFLVEDGNLSSHFGLININQTDCEISILGMDDSGKEVVSKNMTLKAGERIYKHALDFFGMSNQVELAKRIKWIKVHASQRLVGFSNSESLDGSQLMSSGAFKTLNSSMIIPHIAQQTNQWYTRAVLINASEKEVELEFQDHSEMTDIAVLRPNGQEDFRFTDVFSTDLPGWGRFSQKSGEAALAGIEVFGRRDGAQQAAALEMAEQRRTNANFTYIRNNLFFTHVAKDTVNFWTGITLVNMMTMEQTCRIKAYNDQGTVLSTLDKILSSEGKLLTTVANLFPGVDDISWIEVEADRGITGFELFGDHANKRLAGFPAADFLADKLIFPYLTYEENKTWTGIALLNVSDQAVHISMKAYSNAGSVLLEREMDLQSKTKLVATLQNLFAGMAMPSALGYLIVEADSQAINGFALFGSLKNGGLGENMAGLSAQTE